MAFRVNYNQQRSDRERAKEQKKKERLARREEDSQKRKAGLDGASADDAREGGEASGAPRKESE
jgi:hypothetical protein